MTIKEIETMDRELWRARNFLLDLAENTDDPKVKNKAMLSVAGIWDCMGILCREPNWKDFVETLPDD